MTGHEHTYTAELEARITALMVQRDRMQKAMEAAKELAAKAQMQLRSAQVNWQEECYFEADDLLTGALAALDGAK